jgi:hypothetical protein
MVALLRRAGHEVSVHVILLGVGGTIYQNTPDTPDKLGIRGPSAAALMRKLSMYAVNQMHVIIQARRAREREPQKAPLKNRRQGFVNEPWKPGRKRKGVG